MKITLNGTIDRRSLLSAGVAATGMLAMPSILRAQDKSLKVGVYGGYFKKSFDEHIFPAFTEATGIAVESVAEPTGEAWLVQLEQAAKANQAPADISMMSQVATLKGQSTELWQPIDISGSSMEATCLSASSTNIRTGASAASARSPGTSRWSPTPTSTRKRRPRGRRSGTRQRR